MCAGVPRSPSGSVPRRGGLAGRRRPARDGRLAARRAPPRGGPARAERLRSAGTELTPARFLGVVIGAAIGAFAVVSLLFPPLLGLVAAAVAIYGCFAWLSRRLDKRREQFVAQLPEVARLLSNGASAGLSIPAAIELAVREIDSPADEGVR